jgi:hypothetical protein
VLGAAFGFVGFPSDGDADALLPVGWTVLGLVAVGVLAWTTRDPGR